MTDAPLILEVLCSDCGEVACDCPVVEGVVEFVEELEGTEDEDSPRV